MFEYVGLIFLALLMLLGGGDKIPLAVLFLVSSIVFIYSSWYIRRNRKRYWFFMNLFVISMGIFLSTYNILIIMITWEILSLCSWALISHNYKDFRIRKKALKVITIVSISDIFFLTSMGLLILKSKEIFGHYVFDLRSLKDLRLPNYFYIFLYLGVMGKSSLLPFLWLPDAMVGPTTVSALLHSSTMVKAGFFLLLKLKDYITLENTEFLFYLSLPSLLYSSIMASLERKIKRILAHSTIVNLSILLIGFSRGLYDLSLYHAVLHAIFKSSLFLLVPFLSSRDIFRAKVPRTIYYFLPILLLFIGFPPFPTSFTEGSILENAFLLSVIHIYPIRLTLVILSREKYEKKIPKYLYIFPLLATTSIFYFKIPKALEIIPIILFIPLYFIYWKKKRPRFEKKIEKIFRIKIGAEEVSPILDYFEGLSNIDPRLASLIAMVFLLIGGVLLWYY